MISQKLIKIKIKKRFPENLRVDTASPLASHFQSSQGAF